MHVLYLMAASTSSIRVNSNSSNQGGQLSFSVPHTTETVMGVNYDSWTLFPTYLQYTFLPKRLPSIMILPISFSQCKHHMHNQILSIISGIMLYVASLCAVRALTFEVISPNSAELTTWLPFLRKLCYTFPKDCFFPLKFYNNAKYNNSITQK